MKPAASLKNHPESGAQESSPLEELRPFLYVTEQAESSGPRAPPVVTLEPFTAEQAREVYQRYQNAGNIPACTTPWEELAAATRQLLDELVTNAPPKDREVEAAKARARAASRYAA